MEIFITGSSRSGTTLMARILGRHDRVYALPELHFFEQLWDPGGSTAAEEPHLIDVVARLLAVAEGGYLHPHDPATHRAEAHALVDGDQGGAALPTVPEAYFKVLHQQAEKNGASIPCEHTPQNVFYVRQILDASPDARIIAMVRDPRDVVLSQRAKWRRWHLSDGVFPRREALRSALAYHPINVAILWRGAVRALQRDQDDPRVLTVRYEDLVGDAVTVTKRICEFLGLSWSEGLLAVQRGGSSKVRDEPGATGVVGDRASAWRRASSRERADVAICQWLCRRQMASFDYRPEPVKSARLQIAVQLVTWPPRSLLGLLMNLTRIGSPLRAIRVRLATDPLSVG